MGLVTPSLKPSRHPHLHFTGTACDGTLPRTMVVSLDRKTIFSFGHQSRIVDVWNFSNFNIDMKHDLSCSGYSSAQTTINPICTHNHIWNLRHRTAFDSTLLSWKKGEEKRKGKRQKESIDPTLGRWEVALGRSTDR